MSYIEQVAASLDTPPDLIKIVLCLTLNYPLCVIVKRLPGPTIKSAVITCLGLYYLVGIFNFYNDLLVIFAQSLVAYLLAWNPPKSRLVPWFNMILQMAILMITHCREQFSGEDYVNNIGISGSQMILVIKLTSYVWDMHDATRKVEDLNSHQKACRITERPTVLNYFAWCLFFPSVLTGPTCQYRDFEDWLTRDRITYVDKSGKEITRKIPSGAKAALLKTVVSLVWTYLYFTCTKVIHFDFALSPTWRSWNFFHRISYLAAVALTYQLKYYVAWGFSEAACMLCGLGYNGPHPTKENRFKWDRVENVRPIKIITGQNCHGYVNNWNINTANWLRYYTYERVTPKGKKPGAKSTLATFFVSAVWHGTRPGYYLTFILTAVYQRFGRIFRHKVRPIFLGTNFKLGYDLLCWFVTQTAFGFAVQPFIVLDMAPSRQIWSGVYYWPIIGCVVSFLVLIWPLGRFTGKLRRELHQELKTVE